MRKEKEKDLALTRSSLLRCDSSILVVRIVCNHLDKARQMAELLQQGATDTGPKSFWEGAAQLGKAFIARGANERADQAESTYADTYGENRAHLNALQSCVLDWLEENSTVA